MRSVVRIVVNIQWLGVFRYVEGEPIHSMGEEHFGCSTYFGTRLDTPVPFSPAEELTPQAESKLPRRSRNWALLQERRKPMGCKKASCPRAPKKAHISRTGCNKVVSVMLAHQKSQHKKYSCQQLALEQTCTPRPIPSCCGQPRVAL